jgi:hypothetical protein
MSRRNKFIPKFADCTPELKTKGRKLVLSWEQKCLSVGRPIGHIKIFGLAQNEKTLKGSVAEAICGWIDCNPEWESHWSSVLERVDTCAFLQTGFNNFLPDINWLFSVSKNGRRGIELVMDGKYDRYRIKRSANEQYFSNRANLNPDGSMKLEDVERLKEESKTSKWRIII